MPGYYECPRYEVMELIDPASRLILDVGCASGVLGASLKQKQGATVWGVEYQPEAAQRAAECLDKVIPGTIEAALTQLPENYFDTIICADVLEHLVDPWAVLAELKNKLRSGGQLVASIPNVRHWSVLLNLLEGHWQYRDFGLLDRTHLRFFTRESIIQLFEGAGLRLTELYGTILDTDRCFPQSIVDAMRAAGMKTDSIQEDSQHFQYLAVAWKEVNDLSGKETPAAGASPLVSMVMLTWNQLEYTRNCLASILQTVSIPFELIVVDNGSTDGTREWLRQQAAADLRIRLVENDENRGFAAGCNQGMQLAKGQYILLLNNDLVLYDGWLERMLALFGRRPDAGIIGPMTDHASGPQELSEAGSISPEQLPQYAADFGQRYQGRVIPCRRVVGFCMLFRRELTDKIGLLDERFGSGNYEDDDFCLRAELAGYRNYLAGDVFVHHAGGATFNGNQLDREATNVRNRRLFMEKWNPAVLEESLLRRWLSLTVIEDAERLAQRGMVEQASDLLVKRGIGVAADWPEPYIRLARLLLQDGRLPEAEAVLQQLPSGADAALTCALEATLLVASGDEQLTTEKLQKLMMLNPESAAGLYLQGMMAHRGGRIAQAEDYFNRAMAADPSAAEPCAGLGLIRWAAGVKDAATELIMRAVMLDPCNSRIVGLGMEVARSSAKWDTLCGVLKDGASYYPDSRVTADALLTALCAAGRDAEAVQCACAMLSCFGIDDVLLETAIDLRRKVGLHATGLTGMPDGITLCMIVRNEEQNLARCLQSSVPAVDEIVIVDTGSSDRTVMLAEAFGARVLPYIWTDDYAAARNTGLAAAQGGWILLLDADEALAERDYPLIRQAVQQGAGIAWQVVTRNYTDNSTSQGWEANDGHYPQQQAADGWYPSLKVRLFPHLPEICFRGRVHEMVDGALREAGIIIMQAPFVVHHYGELDQVAVLERKRRYYRLGAEKLAEFPDDTELLAELAIQAGELGLSEQALELWNRLLTKLPGHPEALFNRSHALISLGRYAEAAADASQAVRLMPEHKEAILNLAVAELHLGQLVQARERVERLAVSHQAWPPLLALRLCCAFLAGDVTAADFCYAQLKAGGHGISAYLDRTALNLEKAGMFELAEKTRNFLKRMSDKGQNE